MRYTIVFEWPDGQEPRIGIADEFMGGKVCAAQYSDALAELQALYGQNPGLQEPIAAEPTGPSNHVCTGVVCEWDSINSRLLPPNALKAELARLRESGWRPIETMPWDMERVLIVHKGEVKIGARIAHNAGGTVWEISGTSTHETLMQQLGVELPTVWQPLPALPPPPSEKA